MERFYYGKPIDAFLQEGETSIFGTLSAAESFDTAREQKNAWGEEIRLLKSILAGYSGYVFFEYSIPRLGRRIDVVLLINGVVLCLEFKAGAERFETADRDQVWDYALDFKNFHEPSRDLYVAPILVATDAPDEIFELKTCNYDAKVYTPLFANGATLKTAVETVLKNHSCLLVDGLEWARGRYSPTPTIIQEEIWPAGRIPDMQADQCVPYIEWHMPKVQKAKGIQIIFSGGGYKGSHPDGFEVAPARRYLNEKGVAVVTLKYRTPRPSGGFAKHTSAWQDLQRAIRKVRSEAPSKGLDPNRIGIMGSSAGGHLALLGATSSRRRTYLPMDEIDALPCKVQWAVAVYPAYALTDGIDGYNANGGNGDDDRLVADFSFDMDTCPVLFIHGDSDGFSAMTSVKAWEQLRRMGVQGEVHTLATRPHCFQASAAPGTGSYTYLDRIWEFMNHRKVVR